MYTAIETVHDRGVVNTLVLIGVAALSIRVRVHPGISPFRPWPGTAR